MSDDLETLVQVKATYFTAGLVFFDDTCIEAAPILGWCKGKARDELRSSFKALGWVATVVRSPVALRVVLTKAGIDGMSETERQELVNLFGVPMIESITGGAFAFEGEYSISPPPTEDSHGPDQDDGDPATAAARGASPAEASKRGRSRSKAKGRPGPQEP